MIPQTISHYRILGKLGAGGMGEVYKAQDTRLDRFVALKVLPSHMVQDADRVRRFIHEAKAASALNHPHIVTVHEIGEITIEPDFHSDDYVAPPGDDPDRTAPVETFIATAIHYITMEFIDGDTLKVIIHGHGTGLRRLIEYMAQVAEGLFKAHSAGIVHRDLKPDNVMVTHDGYAKILDFGLAKLAETADLPAGVDTEAATAIMNQTRSGVIMGTVGYMSPEQAQGKPLDYRSDIFSFGCILYEVATRRKPFEGDSVIDTLHKIVYAQPPPITEFNPHCPAELQRIVRKCLAKDRDSRYQSMKEVATDLREQAKELENTAVTSPGGLESTAAAAAPTVRLNARTGFHDAAFSTDDATTSRLTRFSRSGFLMAALGLLSVIVIWPAYRQSDVGSELRLDAPRAVALSKARQTLAGFGYDAGGLEPRISFLPTELQLQEVARREGLGRAREAVRDGAAAQWQVAFVSRGNKEYDEKAPKIRPGEFLVSVDAHGRLHKFMTPPKEGIPGEALDRERALDLARAAAVRDLGVDPSGYDLEALQRANPPGVWEITWRNPEPVFGHRGVVRAALQGDKITALSRSFEPMAANAAADDSGVHEVLDMSHTVICLLASFAAYAWGVFVLVKSQRRQAFTRRLPLIVSALAMVGTFLLLLSSQSLNAETVIISFVLSAFAGAFLFPTFAGFVEWVHGKHPERLYGALDITEGRALSPYASASVLHGVLIGAAVTGLRNSFEAILPRYVGFLPEIGDVVTTVQQESFTLVVVAALLVSVLIMSSIAMLVEALESATGKGMWATLAAALFIALLAVGFDQPAPAVFFVSLTGTFLAALALVYGYRTRGLAAACIAYVTYYLLDQAVISRSLGDPAFILQSNLLLAAVAVLLAWGVIGAVKGHRARSVGVAAAR